VQLPEDYIKQTKPVLGDSIWGRHVSALDTLPPVSIRLNPNKAGGMTPREDLLDKKVPWCADGYYLKERPNFTFDPLLHAGLYYVQEASSMFLDHVLRQHLPETPVRMLDLCAAPGGKSIAARTVLPAGSLLVSNEPVRQRAQVLVENMMKQGHPDIIVTNNYARDIALSGLMFDVVLADVPCSGEGMFRKDHAAITEWSLKNVDKCWRLQREIIADVWPALRDGGLLVYSTCTFNTHEDEENVRYIMENLGAEALAVNMEADWQISGSLLNGFQEPVYRFIPGMTLGEGLFMAVLRKNGGCSTKQSVSYGKTGSFKSRDRLFQKPKQPVLQWLCSSDSYEAIDNSGTIFAIPQSWKADYDLANKRLRVMTAGVQLGEVKGKDIIPTQSLALSTALSRNAFPTVELSYADAVSYLRRETVDLPSETPRGHVLATYRSCPLGFLKNIGSRANNLYPAEWKIHSGHLPEGVCEVLT